MQNRKFLYNAALAFGLVVATPAFADDLTPADPSTMTQQEREAYRSQRQAEMSGKTEQEREAYRSQRQVEKSDRSSEQRAENRSSNREGQGQGTMARDGSGAGGQYGRNGGGKQGGGYGRNR